MNWAKLRPDEIIGVGDLLCVKGDNPNDVFEDADCRPPRPGKPCIASRYGDGDYATENIYVFKQGDVSAWRDATPANEESEYRAFLDHFSTRTGQITGASEFRSRWERLRPCLDRRNGNPTRLPLNPIYSAPLPLP